MAAVFYFCAPVAGLTGSSSYNDAAGVFFLLAAFDLLLLRDDRYLFAAGILAGFCYAIKLPGIDRDGRRGAVPGGAATLACRAVWWPPAPRS